MDLINQIKDLLVLTDFSELKNKLSLIISRVEDAGNKKIELRSSAIEVDRQILLNELNQINHSFTIERAKHYCKQLLKGLTETKTTAYSEINLNRWKEYEHLLTDSLWLYESRDRSGAHNAKYWGNFIPQIPNQLLQRFTKVGDWVLDPFLGSGTTLIECRKLNRNGLGIELLPEVAEIAKSNIETQKTNKQVKNIVVNANSQNIDLQIHLSKNNIENFKFILYHPPYWNIIKFSDRTNDISNADTLETFLLQMQNVFDNTLPYLAKNHFFAVVIGDKYEKGSWVPLGFHIMNQLQQKGHLLKSIIVKNFDQTKGKQNQKALWRYRALAGGFYIFKHEYIFLFQKKCKL